MDILRINMEEPTLRGGALLSALSWFDGLKNRELLELINVYQVLFFKLNIIHYGFE